MVFAMNGVPAIAITTENFIELTTDITHTKNDTIEKVDAEKIYGIAL